MHTANQRFSAAGIVTLVLLASAGLAHAQAYNARLKNQTQQTRVLRIPHGRSSITVRTAPGQTLCRKANGSGGLFPAERGRTWWTNMPDEREGKRANTYLNDVKPGTYRVMGMGARNSFLRVTGPAHRTFSATAGKGKTREIRFSPYEKTITVRMPKGAVAWIMDGKKKLNGYLGHQGSNGDRLLTLGPGQTARITGGAVLGQRERVIRTLPANP